MKKSIIFAAIMAAGVGVLLLFDSCTKSSATGLDGTPSIQELRDAIVELQGEVADLKTEVEALKNSSGGDGGGDGGGDVGSGENTSGEFLVDGLWFNRGGLVSSKMKRYNIQEERPEDKDTYEYRYDEQGRLAENTFTQEMLSPNNSGIITLIQENEYLYSGKTVTITSTNWSTTNENNKTVVVTTTEYY